MTILKAADSEEQATEKTQDSMEEPLSPAGSTPQQ